MNRDEFSYEIRQVLSAHDRIGKITDTQLDGWFNRYKLHSHQVWKDACHQLALETSWPNLKQMDAAVEAARERGPKVQKRLSDHEQRSASIQQEFQTWFNQFLTRRNTGKWTPQETARTLSAESGVFTHPVIQQQIEYWCSYWRGLERWPDQA